MKRFIYLILALLVFSACQNSANKPTVSLDEIPAVTPKKLISIDHADNFYFSHLGYSSVVLKNGDILIPDRDNVGLIVIDTEGNLKKQIREGRGPGEVLDVQYFVVDNSGFIYTYDQGNNKLIKFDGAANLAKELIPIQNKDFSIEKAYLMPDSTFILELFSFAYLMDAEKESEVILAQYDPISNSFGKEIYLKDIPQALYYSDGKLRGSRAVHFAAGILTAYHQKNSSLFIFDPKSQQIAEINASFDTLKTISVKLPREQLTASEIDSLKKDEHPGQWRTMASLLPEYKSTASQMKIWDEQIWLQTNLRGDYQKWLVLNMKGEIEQIVNLPKNSMLTHISNQHLGVRLDDATFGLFEPVVFD